MTANAQKNLSGGIYNAGKVVLVMYDNNFDVVSVYSRFKAAMEDSSWSKSYRAETFASLKRIMIMGSDFVGVVRPFEQT